MKAQTTVWIIVFFLLLLSAGLICYHTTDTSNAGVLPAQAGIDPLGSGRNQGTISSEVPLQMPGGIPSGLEPGQRPAPGHGRTPRSTPGSEAQYGTPFIIYSVTFLGLSLAAYYALIHKKAVIKPGKVKVIVIALLGAGLILRMASATLMEGHPFDIGLFRSWATTAANGLFSFYSNSRSSDYPPLYIYVLFLVGKTASLQALNPYYTFLLKLPSMAADIVTAYLVYRLARKYSSQEISVFVSALYIFNPAVLINSTLWGQVDSFFTLMVVLSAFMLAEKRIGLASAFLTAAVLMKPQGIIFFPVIFFELVRRKNLRSILEVLACSLGTALIIILPFSLNQGPLWIFQLFSRTIGEYPYASVNAFNFFSLFGANYVRDTSTFFLLSYHDWGLIFIMVVTLLSWFIYIKKNSSAFAPAAALLQIAGVFTFSTGMHERYLFPAAALSILAFIYLRDRRLLLLTIGFSSAIYINTHAVLFDTLNGIRSASFSPVLIFTSLLNIFLLACLVKVLCDMAFLKRTYAFPGGFEVPDRHSAEARPPI